MIHHFKRTAALAAGLFWTVGAFSQESANSAGGDASGSGGTVSYSIGQTVYTSHPSASGTLNQGVQQPFEFFTLGINRPEQSISLSIFPNPTSVNLTLQISDLLNLNWSYHIFDLNGKLVLTGPIRTEETLIDTSLLPRASYFLQVSNQENDQTQSFKFIKS